MNSKYVYIIRKLGINSDVINMILNDKDVQATQQKQKTLQLRYEAEEGGVPIFSRKLSETQFDRSKTIYRLDDKVSNCINRNFESDIVDTKIGYVLGIPINYHVDGESDFEDTLTDWNKEQYVADKDSELGKTATITGLAPRLLYVDKEGKPQMRNVPFDEVIIISDSEVFTPNYALRMYTVPRIENGTVMYKGYIEFYDDTHIHEFIDEDNGWEQVKEPTLHMFEGCPLYALPNNEELKGDFEKVLPAIDAYNRTLSDVSDEIEQFRLAYLVLRGVGIDDDTLEEMRSTGTIEMYDENGKVDYLTKDVNDTLIENHLDRLEANIYKDAKSVDFSDQNFTGGVSASGVSLQYKMQGLENKSATFARKVEAMLTYQYKLLNVFWALRGQAEPDVSTEIKYMFRRNLPVDVQAIADATAKLKGNVSESTRLSQIPFISDTDAELKSMLNDIEDLTGPDFEGNQDKEEEV